MSPVFRDLVGLVDGVRAGLVRRSVRVAGVWLAALALTALLFGVVLANPDRTTGGVAWPLLLDLLIAGAVVAAIVMHRRLRERWLGEGRVAEAIEGQAELEPGTLRGSVELARGLPAGVSSGLAEAAARRVMGRLPAGEALAHGGVLGEGLGRWARRGFAVLGLVAPVLVLAMVFAPARTTTAAGLMARPISAWTGPVLPALEVTPGTSEVLRGSDVDLAVDAVGRETVTVHWQSQGDIARTVELTVTEGAAGHRLREVRAETVFWVSAPDGARTERHVLTPVDPLLVGDLTVGLTYPAYTGRFAEEFRGAIPPLDLPIGTTVRIDGNASRPLRTARLIGDSLNASLELDIEAERFSYEWSPRQSGSFGWEFVDVEGASPELFPDPIEITMVSDAAPEVAILMPGQDTVMAASLKQPLVIQSGDDYGVDRVELVVYRVTALGERGEPVVQGLDLGGSAAAMVRPVMDFTRWTLLPGDTIRYFARAVDNAPNPQVGVSQEYALRLPLRSDLQNELQDRLETAAEQLEALTEEAAEQAEELRDLEREAAAEEPEPRSQRRPGEERTDFEEREDIQQALEDQEELLTQTDSLAAELERLQEEMEELADPELQENLERLQELMDELASEEMRERLDEMGENLEEMDRSEMDQALDEMAEDQESLRDRMEEALERLKRAAMEQEFRAAGEEAEELARQQEALAQAMEEGTEPELRAQQQELLERRAENLEHRLEQLQEQLLEQGDPERQMAVQEAEATGNEAQQSMEQARQQAEQGQMQDAAESAQQAAEQMDEMAQQLQNAQQQMNNEMMEALEQALRQTANDALALARRQSELREEMRGASQETLAAMRADEAALEQGVQNMTENMAVMDRITQNDGRELNGRMGQALEAIEQTIAALQDRRGRTPSPFTAAENAIQALNQVAQMAMENARQLGEGQGQSNAEQMMQQLQQMAQEQSQINEQTSQMEQQQMGEQAQQQQMEQMSQGQQQVADELGEMSDQAGEEGMLGDVEAMAEEAAELAEMLQGGRLDAELRERQDRLFHRLLDAGRSLEKEEESEERESEEPGEFERGTVLPLSAEDLAAFRYRLPDAAALRGLTPAERRMVLQYFERLNRQRARAGGGGPGGGR